MVVILHISKIKTSQSLAEKRFPNQNRRYGVSLWGAPGEADPSEGLI